MDEYTLITITQPPLLTFRSEQKSVESEGGETSTGNVSRRVPNKHQTMGQKSLDSLAVMSVEKDELQHLSHNRVIDQFDGIL